MSKQPGVRTRTRLAPGVRRAAILDAATGLILRHGTAGLTMANIAAEANVVRGTLYLYFDSTDGIVAALRDRYVRALIGELEPLLATGGSGSRLRRLDAFIAALATAIDSRRDLHHALFGHSSAAESPLTEAFRGLLRRFIQDGRDAGEFVVPDVGLTTDFLVAGIHAVLTGGLNETGITATAVMTAQKLARRTLTATPSHIG